MEATMPNTLDRDGSPAVIYRRPRCPHCSSPEIRVARKRPSEPGNPAVRDMKCQACGAAFKLIEA